MQLSVFDLFKIGIGPSSSHTVGPMRAAALFVDELNRQKILPFVNRVQVDLFGSLSATGTGHGTVEAILLGLCGEAPESVPPNKATEVVTRVSMSGMLGLSFGIRDVLFSLERDIVFHGHALAGHPNGMRITAFDDQGFSIAEETYYSVGGGFVLTEKELHVSTVALPQHSSLSFGSAAELLSLCGTLNLSIADVMMRSELLRRTKEAVTDGLLSIWWAMSSCIDRGMSTSGYLPGPLKVKRRASFLYDLLTSKGQHPGSPESSMDWLSIYAMAVNEENACGGRVVTAPTNGAAGIIPSVLRYYTDFIEGANDEGVIKFLLTAGAIGILYKINASISGAEVGCQGEVGVACSMAAAGLCAVLGGTPQQIENAAEIGMEHHLGLTCDPVGGRVQIPCIERNAMGAVKALNAARIAMYGNGEHIVSLDAVISTMKQTGADMNSKYKETSQGGLAVNIIEC